MRTDCKIIFEFIDGYTVELPIEKTEDESFDYFSSEESKKGYLRDIFNAIKNDNKGEHKLYNAIYERASKSQHQEMSWTEINNRISSNEKYGSVLQPNVTMDYLNSQFGLNLDSEIFKDNNDNTARVLLYTNLRVGKQKISGRMIDQNGKELFIISGMLNEDGIAEDARRLESFLKLRHTINSKFDQIDSDSETYEKLKLILKKISSQSDRKDRPVISDDSNEQDIKNNVKKMLLDYIYYRSSYYGIKIKYKDKDYTATEVLSDVLTKISIISHKKSNFSSGTLNAIIDGEIWNHDKDKTRYYISYPLLHNIIKTHHPQWLKGFDMDSDKKFIKFFGRTYALLTDDEKKQFLKNFELNEQSDEITEVMSNDNKDKPLWWFLFERINDEDFQFRQKFNGAKKKSIELIEEFTPIETEFGIEFGNTETAFEHVEYYRGYNIYCFNKDNKKHYFAIRGAQEGYSGNVYDSIDKVKKQVNDKIQHQNLWDNSFVEFHFPQGETYIVKNCKQYFPKGSIIQILGVENLGSKLKLSQEERNFLMNNNFSEVYQYIYNNFNSNIDNITQVVDTPEKVMLFFHLRNKYLDDHKDEQDVKQAAINNALETIKKAANPEITEENAANESTANEGVVDENAVDKNNSVMQQSKFFYIDDIIKHQQGSYNYRAISTTFTNVENYQKTGFHNRNEVNKQVFRNLSTVLKKQFGIEIKFTSNEKLVTDLGHEPTGNVKAFIKGEDVYVNLDEASIDDALHEYVHLVLAYMKKTPQLQNRYVQLMEIFGGMKYYSNLTYLMKAETLQDFYTDASIMDLLEEQFCRSFSNWVMNGVNSQGNNFDNLFITGISDVTQHLFSITGNYELQSFYGKKTIYSFYHQFVSDLSQLSLELKNKKKMKAFKNTSETRKKVSYISKKIKEGKIKEECE